MFSNIFKQTEHIFYVKMSTNTYSPKIPFRFWQWNAFYQFKSLNQNSDLKFWYIIFTVLEMFHKGLILLIIVHVDKIKSWKFFFIKLFHQYWQRRQRKKIFFGKWKCIDTIQYLDNFLKITIKSNNEKLW